MAEHEDRPENGHKFWIMFTSAGSYGIVQDDDTVADYKDSSIWSDQKGVTVRAWNLRDALEKAAALPLGAWHDQSVPIDTDDVLALARAYEPSFDRKTAYGQRRSLKHAERALRAFMNIPDDKAIPEPRWRSAFNQRGTDL